MANDAATPGNARPLTVVTPRCITRGMHDRARRHKRLTHISSLLGVLTLFMAHPRLQAAEPLSHIAPSANPEGAADVPYDFDAPPQGLFYRITMAEGFEEELGLQQTQEIVPINATDQFSSQIPAVFVVFHLHQHYQGFQVFGRLFPEAVPGRDPTQLLSQDAMQIALEDNSGYLTFTPPTGAWVPGRYRVEIHVGEAVNAMSLFGTMRFLITAPTR